MPLHARCTAHTLTTPAANDTRRTSSTAAESPRNHVQTRRQKDGEQETKQDPTPALLQREEQQADAKSNNTSDA
jgi:hypothetical protein